MAQSSLPRTSAEEMRYLAQFLQIVCSKTGVTGLLRAWAHGLLQWVEKQWGTIQRGTIQWSEIQQPPVWELIPIGIPIRNDAVGLGLRTPSRVDLQRREYQDHSPSGRPVSRRNF